MIRYETLTRSILYASIFTAGLAIGSGTRGDCACAQEAPPPYVEAGSSYSGCAGLAVDDEGLPGHIVGEGIVTASDQELESGNVAIGASMDFRVLPASIARVIFSTHRGQRVQVVIRRAPKFTAGPGSRLDRDRGIAPLKQPSQDGSPRQRPKL